MPTTEELAALLTARGLPVSAWEDFTLGMAINYACAYDKMQRRANGETVHEPDEQYRVLKSMEPQIEEMYAAGEIREDKYQSYKASIRAWEEMTKEDG